MFYNNPCGIYCIKKVNLRRFCLEMFGIPEKRIYIRGMNANIIEFLQYIKVEKNYSDRTVEAYRDALRDYEDFVTSRFGSFDPLHPELTQARAWMVDMGERHWKVASIKQHICALRSFNKFLRKKGKTEVNPLDLLPTPQTPKPLPVWVREEQMDALIDDTDFGDDFEGQRDHLLLDLLYSTGMRRSEAAGLRDADIDFSAKTIRVTGKGNKQRLIPFGDELNDILQNYIALRNAQVGGKTEFLLTNENGEGLKPAKVTALAHKYLEQIPSLSRKGAHVLRHSFATNMLSEGADLMAVKELLGHASLQSTEVYTHLTPQELLANYRQAHPRSKE